MKKSAITLLVISLIALSGCTHDLELTNLHQNTSAPAIPLDGSKTVGILASDDSGQNSKYIEAIANSLRKTNNFDRVIYPYNPAYSKKTDYTVSVSVNPVYSGKISNFFVSWPGFLIWAPAIWGYGYNADLTTHIVATDNNRKKSLSTTLSNSYDFRQAEMDRTWTEIGWLEVSLIPFIGGFYMTGYDKDVTPEFIHQVSNNYGSEVSKGIIKSLQVGK